MLWRVRIDKNAQGGRDVFVNDVLIGSGASAGHNEGIRMAGTHVRNSITEKEGRSLTWTRDHASTSDSGLYILKTEETS